MLKKNIAILPITVLMLSVIMFSGCGKKAEDAGTMKSSPAPQASPKTEKKTGAAELPKATGNVDDATSAIIDSANKEGSLISDEEADAKASVSEDQELDDLSNSYDEGEL